MYARRGWHLLWITTVIGVLIILATCYSLYQAGGNKSSTAIVLTLLIGIPVLLIVRLLVAMWVELCNNVRDIRKMMETSAPDEDE